jgi:beta-galactosidase/beta-glucuronidase
VRRDDELLQQGRLPVLDVPAGGSVEPGSGPFQQPENVPGTMCWINFSFSTNEDTLWAKRGLELANAQFELLQFERPEPAALNLMPDVTVDVFGENVVVQGEDFRLVFDGGLGVLTDWTYQGVPLLLAGPRLNIWRAPTENDIHMAKTWLAAGFDRLEQRVTSVDLEVEPQAVVLVVEAVLAGYSISPAMRCTYRLHNLRQR